MASSFLCSCAHLRRRPFHGDSSHPGAERRNHGWNHGGAPEGTTAVRGAHVGVFLVRVQQGLERLLVT
jgi:hypothetical protein